jgi:putative hydrolase of the HAD superfamily
MIAILTNNGALLREHIDELAPELRPIFGEHIYTSSEFDTRKPDAEVFYRCLSRIGVEAQDTIFIDDSEKNTKGAESAGLQPIHFTPDMVLSAHPYITDLLK